MKRFVLLLFFISSLFAIDKEALLEAAKNNPNLLNRPEVQKILKEKEQSTLKDKTVVSQKELENKVTVKELKTTYEIDKAKSHIFVYKPFEFLSRDKLIRLIQSKQQIETKVRLKRFGEKFFYNKNKLNTSILAVPDYYQVNVGDIIKIQIFGAGNKRFNLKIDNNGNIYLPVIGPIYVAGLRVSEVKELIVKKLKPTYPNSKIVVNVKINSFIQVNLTGYVPAPGVYNLTSLSTVKDLLIVAKGFGNIGSMREVYLLRGGKILKIIDFYKLIKDGKLVDTTLLRNGDVIYIPS